MITPRYYERTVRPVDKLQEVEIIPGRDEVQHDDLAVRRWQHLSGNLQHQMSSKSSLLLCLGQNPMQCGGRISFHRMALLRGTGE